jgi:hypothetical protein
MSLFNRSAAAVKPALAQDLTHCADSAADAGNSTVPADATASARDAMFEKLSKMFRRAGTGVAAQALFRVVMEYRVESREKLK